MTASSPVRAPAHGLHLPPARAGRVDSGRGAGGGPARASAGNPLLDHLLGGGFPRGAAVLLLGGPYSGKEQAAAAFGAAGAAAGEGLVVCLTGRTPADFRDLAAPFQGLAEAEAEDRVLYVDCFAGLVGVDPGERAVVATPDPSEPTSVLRAFAHARARLPEGAAVRIVVLGVTDLALHFGSERGRPYPWLRRLAAQFRTWGATALLTAESRAHEEAELALLRHLCDGALEFHEAEDGRTFLRTRGLGGAATRGWVEYVAGDRGLDIVGSFTEQKIR